MDAHGRAKIVGFRLTVVTADVDPTQPSDPHIGSNRWSAPEAVNDGNASKETDIFSLAMLMIEVGINDILCVQGRVRFTVLSYFYRYSPGKSHSMTANQLGPWWL